MALSLRSPGVLLRLDERLSRRASQQYLLEFTRRMFPTYIVSEHHRLIAKHLEAVERGIISRLIITIPPRHGKSELASVQFPAWFLGRNPDRRIIACSYTAALAYKFSRRSRNLLNDPKWPFEVRPASDMAQVQSWDLHGHLGGYAAAGVGGSITGMGASVLLIDDPVKDAAEADSVTKKENVWEWYTSTAYTRLEPDGAVVVIGTRWSEDDLIGRLIQQSESGAEPWVVVRIPALSEEANSTAEITLPSWLLDQPTLDEADQPLLLDEYLQILAR